MKANKSKYSNIKECICSQRLLRYSQGKVSESEAEKIERHLAICPMCSDELEGILAIKSADEFEALVSEINAQIDRKVAPRKQTIPLGYWARVAALLAVALSVSALTYFYFSGISSGDVLAENLYRQESVWEGKLLSEDLPHSCSHGQISTSGVDRTVVRYGQPSLPVTATDATGMPEDQQIVYESDKFTKSATAKTTESGQLPSGNDTAVRLGPATQSAAGAFAVMPAQMATPPDLASKKAKPTQEAAPKKTEASTYWADTDLVSNKNNYLSAENENQNDEVFILVEEMPQFYAKEYVSFLEYIRANLQIPSTAKDLQGTVYIEFIVEPNGSLSHAKVVKGIEPTIDAEVVRVVEGSPKWKPGRTRGLPVRVSLIHQLKIQPDQ